MAVASQRRNQKRYRSSTSANFENFLWPLYGRPELTWLQFRLYEFSLVSRESWRLVDRSAGDGLELEEMSPGTGDCRMTAQLLLLIVMVMVMMMMMTALAAPVEDAQHVESRRMSRQVHFENLYSPHNGRFIFIKKKEICTSKRVHHSYRVFSHGHNLPDVYLWIYLILSELLDEA